MNTENQEGIYKGNNEAASILRWAMDKFHPHIMLACSFSPEDIVLMHMMTIIKADARVFAIDTGRLNEETYECAEAVSRSLEMKIEWVFPRHEAVQKLEREKGLFSFRNSLDNRHECCHIRKVEPLARSLTGGKAWVTGMRRDQSVTRTDLEYVQSDKSHDGIIKINPLLDWKDDDVWNYIRKQRLPYNRLHDIGYSSIGCAPCTRAIQPGGHPRAGRWWWESPEHKECGLHVSHRAQKNTSSGN